MTDVPLHEIPYSSPEARSRAGLALDDGRLSVHDHPAHRRSSSKATPIDELLFNVGQSREKLVAEIEAAHAMLPDAAVPRRRGETDERSIAQRLRMFLELVDRRSSELLDANNREVEKRRMVEARVEEIQRDMARLDFLDEMNAALNAHFGTVYRWRLILNHNVTRLMLGNRQIDLHDSEPASRGMASCRGAIDDVMQQIARSRAQSEAAQ